MMDLFYWFWSILLTCMSLLLITIVIICKVRNNYWKRKGVFTIEPQLFFGNVKNVIFQKEGIGENLKFFYNTLKKHGKSFGGYYFLLRPVLVISDLDLIKRILITDFEHFTDHLFPINKGKEPLSGHLYALRGDQWKSLRAKLSSSFNVGKSKIMFKNLLVSCKKLEVEINKKIENKEIIDLYQILSDMAIHVIGSCAFGLEFTNFSGPQCELKRFGLEYMHDLSIWTRIVITTYFTIPKLFNMLNFRIYSNEITSFFMKFTTDLIMYRQKNNIIRNDFMNLLLQLQNGIVQNNTNLKTIDKSTERETEESFSISDIAAQCFSFYTAGYEATSPTLTFCVYELSLNIELQEKLRNEIITVLQNFDKNVTYESLLEMKLLNDCIYETLRKYPPAPCHTRVCTKTYKIPESDVIITEGTTVIIPLHAIHMDSSYYPDPERFDPERFSEKNKFNRPSGAWLPFGDGPRICIAYQFGLIQMKAILATLLLQFRFSIHPSTKVPVVISPKHFVVFPSSKVLVCASKI